jgi:hypothetical protein
LWPGPAPAILIDMSRPSHLNWSIFRGSNAVADGVLTPKQLKSRSWREVRPDIFVDARVPLDHSVACQAVALVMPDRICFSGASAAYLLGVWHAADYEDQVQLTIGLDDSVPKLPGVRVRKTDLTMGERDWIDGLPVTSALRTAWDVGAGQPVADSVPIIDGLLGLALVTPAELLAYAESHLSRRGGRSAARAFELADGRARTPEASRLRLAIMAAGLPRPTPNHPIAFSGGVRTPELAWPAQQVGLTWPTDQTRYSDEDWLVLRIDPENNANALPAVLRDLRAALLGRGWRGPRS